MSLKTRLLNEIFYPKPIAIIGTSASTQATEWSARLLDFGDTGHLYQANPRVTEISGLKAYPTVRDIPGPIDYTIFNIPAQLAPQIIKDCATKGVKMAHIHAAVLEARGRLLEAGIPVYPTIKAAAKAVSKLIGYREFTEKR